MRQSLDLQGRLFAALSLVSKLNYDLGVLLV